MAGTKISDATLRSTLKGTEQLPIVDTDLPKGKTTTANLKTYCTPDLSEYALKTEIPDVSGLATKTEVQDKLDTNTYNSDKATFATKTELSAKVGGTGVTAIKVVSALPDPQDDGVLYIVTGEEA